MTRNYYATSDHRNIGMIVGAYCDMVQGRINEGFEPFLLTIMFREDTWTSKRVIPRYAGKYRRGLQALFKEDNSASEGAIAS